MLNIKHSNAINRRKTFTQKNTLLILIKNFITKSGFNDLISKDLMIYNLFKTIISFN